MDYWKLLYLSGLLEDVVPEWTAPSFFGLAHVRAAPLLSSWVRGVQGGLTTEHHQNKVIHDLSRYRRHRKYGSVTYL